MPIGQMQKMTEKYEEIRTLNNVAVEYFKLGLWDISYQIWNGLYQVLQKQSLYDDRSGKLFPVISCNIGNALRRLGSYEEAYIFCRQGLQCCFEKGYNYAVPELILQLSALYTEFGEVQQACSMFLFGKNLLLWSSRRHDCHTLEDVLEKDFLLYCQEDFT